MIFRFLPVAASRCLPLCAALFSSAALRAEVTLPALISNHAVLRASPATRIWGKAAPGEEVTVSLAGQSAHTPADAAGHWQVALDLQKTGPGPFDLTVNQRKVTDVLVGEVWLASGQSNMEFGLRGAQEAAAELARPINPQLRSFKVAHASMPEPQDDVQGQWVLVTPESASSVSAVAYYFARDLQAALKSPVGIINSTWGGSSAEAWVSPAALLSIPELQPACERDWALTAQGPERQAVFSRELQTWLQEHQREDHPASDVTPFTSAETDAAGWVPVQLANPIVASGLDLNGAVWLRRTVQVSPVLDGKQILLRAGPFSALRQIYWNGKLINESKLATYSGNPESLWFGVPASLVHAGDSQLAVRIYAPTGPVAFTGDKFTVEGVDATAGWTGKSEFSLENLSQLPPPPAALPRLPQPRETPGYLYNGMVHPLLPVTLSGIIWYQGETNAGRAWQYRTIFPRLITDWRAQFGQGDLPFYFCQLPSFQAKRAEPGDSDWAELREAQSLALQLPQTGAAVLIDTGEADDIHPIDKIPAGQRLARLALAGTYGKKDVVASGPVYQSLKIDGATICVQFHGIAEGLVAQPLPATYDLSRTRQATAPLVRNSPDSELEGFQICGADRHWVWAQAKIEGDSVLVSSPKISAPVAVRYAWASNATANLFNSAGLPAAPFRTDDFPLSTRDRKL